MKTEFEVPQDLSTTRCIGTANDFLDPLVVYVRKISNECLLAPRAVVGSSPGEQLSSTSVQNRHHDRKLGASSVDGSAIGRWQAAARASPIPLPRIAIVMLRAKWHPFSHPIQKATAPESRENIPVR
jgi:hypothetical protein